MSELLLWRVKIAYESASEIATEVYVAARDFRQAAELALSWAEDASGYHHEDPDRFIHSIDLVKDFLIVPSSAKVAAEGLLWGLLEK